VCDNKKIKLEINIRLSEKKNHQICKTFNNWWCQRKSPVKSRKYSEVNKNKRCMNLWPGANVLLRRKFNVLTP
jgi:hypothetical protein